MIRIVLHGITCSPIFHVGELGDLFRLPFIQDIRKKDVVVIATGKNGITTGGSSGRTVGRENNTYFVGECYQCRIKIIVHIIGNLGEPVLLNFIRKDIGMSIFHSTHHNGIGIQQEGSIQYLVNTCDGLLEAFVLSDVIVNKHVDLPLFPIDHQKSGTLSIPGQDRIRGINISLISFITQPQQGLGIVKILMQF